MSRRPCPGIGKLRKDYLQYELAIRRLPTEGTADELKDRLRAGLDSPVAVSPEIIGDVTAAAQNVTKALDEVEKNVSFLEVSHSTSNQLDRAQAHLTHLKNRLSDLKCLELDNVLRPSVDKLIDHADILHIRVIKISEFSLRLGREKESDGSDGLGTRPGIGELAVSRFVDGLLDNLIEITEHTLGMDRKEQRGRSDGLGTRPWSSDDCDYVSHSSSPQYSHFAKLPDSIPCLLNGITELSASSVNCIQQLLWLLVRLEQLTIELQIPHNVALSLLLPLAVGDLRSLLSEALKEGFTIEQFRQIVIAGKLSPCMRNELEQRFFWKVQGPQESLSEYVERIWTVVLATDMNISEGEIISHILQGMHPDYQSRLTLFDRPSTAEELELVVESIEALAIADRQRQESKGAPYTAFN